MSGNDGNGNSGGDPLKTATAIVGLLAGVVAVVYVLGGLVIALRLFFDSFSINTVVTVVGQLPRELVISTAMVDVLLPAATVGLAFGLLAAFVVGIWGNPIKQAPTSGQVSRWAILVLAVITLALVAPAILHALWTDGPTLSILTATIGVLVTFAVAYAGWHELRVVATSGWSTIGSMCLVAAIAAAVALTPAVMFAASLSFEQAHVCTQSSQVPEGGSLIGEGGGLVLLGQEFGKETSVVTLPSEQVTKTEYGDLSSTFSCPGPPGAAAVAKVAVEQLGGHASPEERRLATLLRPRIRFDSLEPWRPIEVGAFLDERFEDGGGHGACERGTDPPCPTVAGLQQLRARPGAPAYLDIRGEQKNGADFTSPAPGCLRSPPAVDCNSGPPAVIYYRRSSHEGKWYWDYWWFLRYNDYNGNVNNCFVVCGDHEGDWEGVTVITTPSLKPEVLGAIYAAHGDRTLVDASVLPTGAGHPLVWVAKGTHAAYPFDCDRDCSQYGGLPEENHDGAVSWGGNRETECAETRCVRPLPELGEDTGDAALPFAGSWAAWPGRWGETCHRGCTGPVPHRESSPVSPGRQPRFECPWAPNRRARPGADGLSEAPRTGDFERLMDACRAQRGGV
ncbi:MAG TPA: hypothetical protein VHR18_07070 [Solirubrobacterales bacterium]|nr:hypothetical protein [Solirubrobacterales bacterium]